MRFSYGALKLVPPPAAGILLWRPDDYGKYRELGMRMFACGADATFVANGARDMVQSLNRQREEYESRAS